MKYVFTVFSLAVAVLILEVFIRSGLSLLIPPWNEIIQSIYIFFFIPVLIFIWAFYE